jgi:hypothetical protein
MTLLTGTICFILNTIKFSRDESNGNNSRSNIQSVTPSAAEMRSFNGTNRSDTVSHLQKSSQSAYGNTNGK